MAKAKNNASTSSEKEPTEEEKAKKLKKDIKEKMLELLKMVDMEERFSISLRDKLPKDYIQEYPDRTICGCDGEIYNSLMNWAYQHKIPNHLAFDRFVEAHAAKTFEKIKQRPKSADRSSARYWKTKSKRGVLGKDKGKKS